MFAREGLPRIWRLPVGRMITIGAHVNHVNNVTKTLATVEARPTDRRDGKDCMIAQEGLPRRERLLVVRKTKRGAPVNRDNQVTETLFNKKAGPTT